MILKMSNTLETFEESQHFSPSEVLIPDIRSTISDQSTHHNQSERDSRATARTPPQVLDEGQIQWWKCFWLNSATLWLLATLSVLLIGGLVTIFTISEAQHGFNSPNSQYRYGWTYGPTVGKFTCARHTRGCATDYAHSSCRAHMFVVES